MRTLQRAGTTSAGAVGKLGDRRNVPRFLQRQSVIEKPVNVPSVPEFLLYHLSSSWRLRQSGTRTLKFLFGGRNSGHFFDPSTANRWNIRRNRSRSRRNLMLASHSEWSEFGTVEWARQETAPARGRKETSCENWELIISGEPEPLCARGYQQGIR